MASFSLLSWNVENLSGEHSEPIDVAEHVCESNPDLFGLFEIQNLDPMGIIEAFNELEEENLEFDKYQFALTQGKETDEILVGIRQGQFEQTIFTQKREFRVDNPYLRPGALVTLNKEGEYYNVLFLHLDSGTGQRDFKNRQQMWERTWSLKQALDQKADSEPARFVAMGDLNTMGKEGDEEITGSEEIDLLRQEAREHEMRLLPKEHDLTFNDGRGLTSNLDHVLTTESVSFRRLGSNGRDYKVEVEGWNDLEGEKREQFINTVADHSSLYCVVEAG